MDAIANAMGVPVNELSEVVRRYLLAQFPKACGCGREFDAVTWAALTLKGNQKDDVECLELRDCACGSTLAVVSAIYDVHAKARELIRNRFGGVL